MTPLPTLYARRSDGGIHQWQILVEPPTYRTISGTLNGVQTESAPTVCKGKQGRTDSEQAQAEARSKFQKKLDEGYSPDPTKVDLPTFFQPMLAHKYGDYPLTFPLYVQPKLDGMRCIARRDGLWSRRGKPILSAPHISDALAPLFHLWPNTILDGELYADHLKDDFGKILSLAKKTRPSPRDLALSRAELQYHIYDLPMPDVPWVLRLKQLRHKLTHPTVHRTGSPLRRVTTYQVHDLAALDHWHEHFLAAGFEGSMIRRASGHYQNKRSQNLLKRKEWQDEEFEIKDVLEGIGNRAGMAGALAFETADGTRFTAALKGDLSYYRAVLAQRNELVGSLATVKYFHLTPGDHPVPRFPCVTAIHGAEGKG